MSYRRTIGQWASDWDFEGAQEIRGLLESMAYDLDALEERLQKLQERVEDNERDADKTK